VSIEVTLDLVELETKHAADADGHELAALDKPVDGSNTRVEKARRLGG